MIQRVKLPRKKKKRNQLLSPLQPYRHYKWNKQVPFPPLANRTRHEIIPLFQIYSTDKPCETRVDESNWFRASFFFLRVNALQGRFPCTVEDWSEEREGKGKKKKGKKEEIRGKKVEKGRNHGIFREKTKRDVVADVVNFSSFRAGWMEKKKRQGREREKERKARKKNHKLDVAGPLFTCKFRERTKVVGRMI